jgi:hypothetical protein
MRDEDWSWVKLLVVMLVGIALLTLFIMQDANAGMRKTVAWRHDRDTLYVTSYARVPVEIRCRWEGPDGWVGRTRGWFEPGQTWKVRTLFERQAHAFDCWRVDKQGDGEGVHR